MTDVRHLSAEELENGLNIIRQSPKEAGQLKLIVRRPEAGKREVLKEGFLELNEGLMGDNWRMRGSSQTVDGSANPDMQITLMNSRIIALLAQEMENWPLAGDQFYVDLDLSADNLPPGTRLALGTAVVEVTAQPHTGCSQFAARFGREALKFVNSTVGKQLHLRGINARIVQAGQVTTGEMVKKVSS
jgi:hypothetical protein